MPDIIYLFQKWWKQIFTIVIIALAVVGAILFMIPPQYLAETTAVAANPIASDKNIVFGKQLQQLYTSFGSGDDVEKMVGTGQLDTIYLALLKQFDLEKYYGLKKRPALEKIRKNTRVFQTEFGQLRVEVWDKNRQRAADMANAVMEKISEIQSSLLNQRNSQMIEVLLRDQQKLQRSADSISSFLMQADITAAASEGLTSRRTVQLQQIGELEKLVGEYRLLADSRPAALMIVEKARPPMKAGKPRRLLILVATWIISTLFATWLVLLLEKKKTGR